MLVASCCLPPRNKGGGTHGIVKMDPSKRVLRSAIQQARKLLLRVQLNLAGEILIFL